MKKVYYILLVALSIMGIWALGIRLAEGMRTTALTSYISWGLWVSIYIYFIGLSAGSFLISTFIYVFGMHKLEKVGRMALLTALFSLGAGLLFIWLDLGHLWRFWEIFATPNFTSMMTIESYLYLIYMALILAELWLLMRNDLAILRNSSAGWRRSLYSLLALGHHIGTNAQAQQAAHQKAHRWVSILGLLGVPTAIGVHGGTGSIFAVAIARPYWNTGLFPIVFLVSALASGSALVTFLYAAFARRSSEFHELLRSLSILTVIFIGIDLLLLFSEILVGLYAGIPYDVQLFRAVMTGPYAYVFWLGQLGLATVIPFVLVGVSLRRREIATAPVPATRRKKAPFGSLSTIMIAAVLLFVAWDVVLFNNVNTPIQVAINSETNSLWQSIVAARDNIGFWVAQLVLIGAMFALVIQRWGSLRFWLGAAGLSTVLGIFAVRLNIVIPGFVVPVLEHLELAYQDSRLIFSYSPSGLEWASTIGLIALIVLLFSVAYELLPVYGRKEEVA